MSTMNDPSILERLGTALQAEASRLDLAYVPRSDGKLQVQLPAGRQLIIRDRGASFSRGDGITVVISREGDDLFEPAQALSVQRFDVAIVDLATVWRPEGAMNLTYTDQELASILLEADKRA